MTEVSGKYLNLGWRGAVLVWGGAGIISKHALSEEWRWWKEAIFQNMLKPFFWRSNAVNSMKWRWYATKMHLWGRSNDSEAIMMTLKPHIINLIWSRVNECRTPTELIRTLEKFRVDLLIHIILNNKKSSYKCVIMLSSNSWALNIKIELPWCSPIDGDSISAPNNLQQDSRVYSTI